MGSDFGREFLAPGAVSMLSVRRPLFVALLLTSSLAPALQPSLDAKSPANAPYKNASLPADQRVADLLSRMTPEEKEEAFRCLMATEPDSNQFGYTNPPDSSTEPGLSPTDGPSPSSPFGGPAPRL